MSKSEEAIRREIKSHVAGLWLNAVDLINAMDAPGMSIERLRRSMPATSIRAQAITFRNFLHDAIESNPDATPEEKVFLEFLLRERDHATAQEGAA